jgi:hypothetical protein
MERGRLQARRFYWKDAGQCVALSAGQNVIEYQVQAQPELCCMLGSEGGWSRRGQMIRETRRWIEAAANCSKRLRLSM